MCKCPDDDNEFIRRQTAKTFEEWNKVLQDLETIAFGAKEWTIPSPHTPTSICKTSRINLNMKIVGRSISHGLLSEKVPFHSILQQIGLKVIWKESASFRSCISSCSHSAAFYWKGRAQTQTTANYFGYYLEQFSTHCIGKVLQLWTTYQGRLHAPIC